MTSNLEITEDIYNFIDRISLEKENIKELVEYVHYKSLLDSFTFFIENSNSNVDFLLTDYVEIISKIQVLLVSIKNKYVEDKHE